MILVDGAVGSRELLDLIRRQGIPCDVAHLPYADACFEGHGPHGLMGVGIERKRISDMLACIQDGRYAGHQRVGMSKLYQVSVLVIEGTWKPDPRTGLLLEAIRKPDGMVVWADRKSGRRVMYRTLRRYLFSVALSGVIILYTRDIAHTAFDITELYHYFQKSWGDHTSMQQTHRGYFWQQDGATRDLMALPTLAHKPSLVHRWAAELPGIGVSLSEDAERVFKTPRDLANSEVEDWQLIPRVGPVKAKAIVGQIRGQKV